MYAIVFDLKKESLEQHFQDTYKIAFDEIAAELKQYGFEKSIGGIYINSSDQGGLKDVYRAIKGLSNIDWFKKSLRDLSVFKTGDWSDFTSIIKE